MAEDTRGHNRNNPLYTHIVASEGVNWAKDSTLNDLVSKADINNTILRELAKQTVPDLEKKLRDAETKAAQRLGDQLESATRQTGQGTTDAIREDTQEFKRYARETKALWQNKLDNLGGLLTSADPNKFISQFGSSLEKRGGEIGQKLGEALGRSKLAGIIGSIVGTAAASAITAALSRSLEISKTFTDLYDTGIAFDGSMQQMTETAVKTRQTLEQMQSSMSKFSTTAAAIGSTRLAEFGKSLLNATRQGGEYAMTQDQLREAAYGYIDMQLQTGAELTDSNDELITGAKNLLDNLTGLSVLTGKSRKEEEAKLRAKMAEAKTRAAVQLLSPEDRKLLEERMAQVPEAARDYVRAAFVELKTGISNVITPEMRQAVTFGLDPARLYEFQQGLTDSSISADQFRASSTELFTNINKQTAIFALSTNRLTGAAEQLYNIEGEFLSQREIIRRGKEKGLSEEQALEEARKKALPKPDTQAFIETQNTFIQSLSTIKSEIDDKMLKGVISATDYMEKFGTKLNELIGKMGMSTGLTGAETGMLAAGGVAGLGLTGAGVAGVKATKSVVEKGAEAVSKSRLGDIARALKGTALEATTGIEAALPEAEAVVAEGTGLLGKLTKLKGGIIGAGVGLAADYGGEALSSAGYTRSGALAQILGETATYAGTGATAAGIAGSVIPGAGTVIGAGGGGLIGGAYGLTRGLYEHAGELFYGKDKETSPKEEKPAEPTGPKIEPAKPEVMTPKVPAVPIIKPTAPGVDKEDSAAVEARNQTDRSNESIQIAEETRAAEMANRSIMEVSNKKATEFYDRYNLASDNMIILLKDIADKLDQLNQNVVDQTSDLDRSITSISGTLI